MENNKLIAEFMGNGKEYEIDINTKTLKSYHTSWDWLMPVVIECFERFGNTDTIDYMRLNDALLTCNIDELYKVVVEFIKDYNKYICGSCGDNCNEYTYNEETDVDECNQCKTINQNN